MHSKPLGMRVEATSVWKNPLLHELILIAVGEFLSINQIISVKHNYNSAVKWPEVSGVKLCHRLMYVKMNWLCHKCMCFKV